MDSQQNQGTPKLNAMEKQIVDAICKELDKDPSGIYVIYNKKKNSVLFNQMTQKPVYAVHYKMLEQIAKEMHGQVVTLEQAIKLLTKI